MKFVCWAWVKTSDYGTVRWGIIEKMRDRFDLTSIKKAA